MYFDVFISYSRKDTTIANRICDAFDRVGISYFIDRQGIGGGMEFPQVIVEAIGQSRLFLFLASENSYKSKFTNNEILYAFNEKPHNSMLPYIIDGSCLPQDLRFVFASINIRNVVEHPVETVLIDDVLRLLGRERREMPLEVSVEKDGVDVAAAEYFLKARSTLDCRLYVDREEIVTIKAGGITKVPLRQGEYLVQVTSLDGLDTIEQELSMPAADKLLFFDLMTLQKERLEIERQLEEKSVHNAMKEPGSKMREEPKYIVVGEGKKVVDISRDVPNGVKHIRIADGVEKIETPEEPGLEYKKRNIVSVIVSDTVKIIGTRAFYKCESLTSINIPASVIAIGRSAFSFCENLASINIPNSVNTIGNSAFSFCKHLTSVIIPDSVTDICEGAFSSCKGLTSVRISNSVTVISNSSFKWCDNLTDINIPDSVTIIDEGAFFSCENLTSVSLPNSVITIGRDAFSFCKRLTSVVIPKSVKGIGESAFSWCSGLERAQILDSSTKYINNKVIGKDKNTFPKHTKIIIG